MNRGNITNWDEVPVVMDLPIASRIVGQTVESLKIRSRKGEFPAFKEGTEWRVEKDVLRAYMRSKCVMPSILPFVEKEVS